MMTSDRIDHVAAAREWLAAAERPDMNLDETTAFAHVGQVHATLALVEQQRIANVIALGSLTAWESELPGHPIEHLAFAAIGDPDTGELRPEIREALGIRE